MPEVSDFESNKERHLAGKMRRNWPDEQECAASGLSVFSTLDEAEAARKAIPGFRKRKVAKGDIASLGLIKDTPSHTSKGHQTWWRPIGDESWLNFEVVA
ncbi:hypothetical protein [Amycolatopsis sp. NPDC004079]|uniref:hypothetical protein n=1 Tax=Amycolatopsis sp. NPDC004079 TaxID=3154549 RepID=UPI00339E8FF9